MSDGTLADDIPQAPGPEPGKRRAGLAGLLLAAGGGRRFGGPKALVRLDGEPLVARALRLLATVCPAGVVVVTGAGGEEAWTAASNAVPSVRRAHNPGWAAGLGGSVAAGIRALPEAAVAVLVLPCDLVNVSATDLERLARAWELEPGRIAAAGFDGRCGPPAILPRRTWAQLLALRGDVGARALIAADAARLVVPMPSAAQDVDTPADLRRLAAGRMLE